MRRRHERLKSFAILTASVAHNGSLPNGARRAITGDLCVERPERIRADRARVATLVWRHPVRAFGLRNSGRISTYLACDGKQPPAAGDAFELVLAAVFELDSRPRDEVDDGA
jgi:hypothetical protein